MFASSEDGSDDDLLFGEPKRQNTVEAVIAKKNTAVQEDDDGMEEGKFHYCCSTNCWQRVPCAEHQLTTMFFANPQLYFQSLITQASNDFPTIVSTLHCWANWALRQADEDKWEVAACLQAQALAVHLQDPEGIQYDQSEQDSDSEEEEDSWDAEARRAKRTQRKNALHSIWGQISKLAKQFFRAEEAEFPGCASFMADFRAKLANSVARNDSRDWPSTKARIAQHYHTALSSLMELCLQLAHVQLQDVSVLLLGSLAKREGMPYSDVELAIILNKPDVLEAVWKAIRFFRFLVILCGETPFPVLPEKMGRMFPAEGGGWSFAPVGCRMGTEVTLIVADLSAMVGLQGEEACSVTTTALRQAAFLCGDPLPAQSYQAALAEYWSTQPLDRRRAAAKELLRAATQKYFPNSVGDTVSLKMIYRMLCLGLEAVALWHGWLVVGTLATISLLRSKGVLQWDTATRIGSMLDLLMTARMQAQNNASSQDNIIAVNLIPPLLLTLANEFNGGLVTYSQLLEQQPTLPGEGKSIVFNMEEFKKGGGAGFETASMSQPAVAQRERERTCESASCLLKLVMIKDHLQQFVSLATRMALSVSCQALRSMSPGHVSVIDIDSTVDARMFLDGPPTLGSHILRLGGYTAKPFPHSKCRAKWAAYYAEEKKRKEMMRFEADTLKVLGNIRPYHRVVGLQFAKGQKGLTGAGYAEFWARVAPQIGWLGLCDQSAFDLFQVHRMLKSRPYLGSYFKVANCGSWVFLVELLQASRGLEGLSFAWTDSEPKYIAAQGTPWEQMRFPLPDLRTISTAVPLGEGTPSNEFIIKEWLVPKAVNLQKLEVGPVLRKK